MAGSSSRPNQTGTFLPSGPVSYSENEVNGTMQRFAGPSQRRQCGDAVLRTLVTPGSVARPLSANTGDGMPHLAIVKLSLAVGHPDDRRGIVRKNARHWREIARQVLRDPEQRPHGVLCPGELVKVAHGQIMRGGPVVAKG